MPTQAWRPAVATDPLKVAVEALKWIDTWTAPLSRDKARTALAEIARLTEAQPQPSGETSVDALIRIEKQLRLEAENTGATWSAVCLARAEAVNRAINILRPEPQPSNRREALKQIIADAVNAELEDDWKYVLDVVDEIEALYAAPTPSQSERMESVATAEAIIRQAEAHGFPKLTPKVPATCPTCGSRFPANTLWCPNPFHGAAR
jgi:hypothetical protein